MTTTARPPDLQATVRPNPLQRQGSGGFRPDIQGLRAVAVGLVVLYHLWPNRLSGGYVGVDVFFVISGYLITSHIYRELVTTRRLSLTRFWARRIRRLLPASLLVLLLTAIAVMLWVPAIEWSNTFRQVAASALYVENWALARDAVDYMAADNVPTAVQHYWSLSVEEQFYLVWPVLVLGLVGTQRMLSRRLAGWSGTAPAPAGAESQRRILLTGLTTLLLGSLFWSIHATNQDQAFAYLSTFTRVWEFAAGAVTGLVVVRLGPTVSLVAGWCGLLAIVWSSFAYTDHSAFPGWIAAVPVLGTVAVILSLPGGRNSAGWWLARPAAIFVGDLSYSIYLIHWPLIVILPAALGTELKLPSKLAIIVATIVLAWLSKNYVEDPLRTRPLLARRPRRAYVFALVGAVTVIGTVALAQGVHQVALDRAQAATADLVRTGGHCIGPEAIRHPGDCGGIVGDKTLVPPAQVQAEVRDERQNACQTPLDSAEVKDCVVGKPGAPETMALVGDSHAGQWLEAMDKIGNSEGISVRVYIKSSCPLTAARRVLPGEQTDARQVLCEQWRSEVQNRLTRDRELTDIVTTSFSSAYRFAEQPGGPQLADPAFDGYREVWQRLVASGHRVHVLRDTPKPPISVPACLATEPDECQWPRSKVLPPDVQVQAAKSALIVRLGKVGVIDFADDFCDESRCYGQIGGVPVFRDNSHLSIEYARLMAPALAAQLKR